MSAGIAAWGTYLPYWRLQRSAIAGVLGSGGGRGTRSVASHDEDTTTLGVEAGRRALAVGPGAGAVQDLFLSTPDPAYLDKTSATTVHAALGLGRACGAYDFAGSSRSAAATLLQALAGAGGGAARRAHGHGRRLRPAYGPGRVARGARQRRRCGRLRVRAGGGGGRAGGPGRRQRRVPRPLARARARPTRTCGRSASARSSTCPWPARPSQRRSRTPGLAESDVDHAVVTGLHVRAVKAASLRAWASATDVLAPDLTAVGRATSAPPTPPWRCATCSSGPSPAR